jgi:hypothetical protein
MDYFLNTFEDISTLIKKDFFLNTNNEVSKKIEKKI